MTDCIFCKIVTGELPSQKVYEDDDILAFRDIAPKAAVHIIFIPKQHISSAADVTDENRDIVGSIFARIADAARELDLSGGYRVVTNVGKHGCQAVPHLHFHVIGGRPMNWPPG